MDKQLQNVDLIYSFSNDMQYKIIKVDMKSDRYNFIKAFLQPLIWSGLKFLPSRAKSPTCIFLPSDPDERADQLKLFFLKK